MTRETKVGIVVSCSFVCLVSMVLYCKIKEGTSQVPTPYAKADGGLPDVPEEPEENLVLDTPPEEGTAPAAASSSNPGSTGKNLAPVQGFPALRSPPPILQASAVSQNHPESSDFPLPPAAKTPERPARNDNAPKLPTTGGGHGGESSKNASELAKEKEKAPKPSPAIEVPAAAVAKPETNHATTPNPTASTGTNDKTNPPFVVPAPVANMPPSPAFTKAGNKTLELPSPPSPAMPEAVTPNSSSGPDKNTVAAPAPTPAPGPMPDVIGNSTPSVNPALLPNATRPAESGQNNPTFSPARVPAANLLPPVPAPNTGNDSTNRGSGSSAGTPAPRRPLGAPPAADDAPEPNIRLLPPSNQLAQGPKPSSADFRPMPPVGAPATAASPPIAIPVLEGSTQVASNVAPQVDSYDEETYFAKANDTFDGISEQFYHQKKYGQALLLFNRDHPQAAESFRQDKPVLQAGQSVYVPPMRVLEKHFASAIPDFKPLLNSENAAAININASAAMAKQYRVQKSDGEYFLEIAKNALGNGDRWPDIYQLNQRYDPRYPIPSGSVLQVPADAHVDAQNMP